MSIPLKVNVNGILNYIAHSWSAIYSWNWFPLLWAQIPRAGMDPRLKQPNFMPFNPIPSLLQIWFFTILIWLTPLMSLEPLESKLNHSNQIWRTLISFEEFLSDLNHFYQIWTTMIRLEPLYRLMFIRLAFSTMAFFTETRWVSKQRTFSGYCGI